MVKSQTRTNSQDSLSLFIFFIRIMTCQSDYFFLSTCFGTLLVPKFKFNIQVTVHTFFNNNFRKKDTKLGSTSCSIVYGKLILLSQTHSNNLLTHTLFDLSLDTVSLRQFCNNVNKVIFDYSGIWKLRVDSVVPSKTSDVYGRSG